MFTRSVLARTLTSSRCSSALLLRSRFANASLFAPQAFAVFGPATTSRSFARVSKKISKNAALSINEEQPLEQEIITPEPLDVETPQAENNSLYSNLKFSHLKIHPATKKAIAIDYGFEYLTKIQEQTLMPILEDKKDMLARSKTGSGKTLAFLIPAVEMLVQQHQAHQESSNNKSRYRSPCGAVIIVAPTRELAMQIYDTAQTLTKYHDPRIVSCGLVMGGANRSAERRMLLERQPSIIVATPGRLLDHLQEGCSRSSMYETSQKQFASEYVPRHSNSFSEGFTGKETRYVVLDEADRILDVGFEQDIKQLFSILNSQSEPALAEARQTILFSATLTQKVSQLTHISLKPDHAYVSTTVEGETANRRCEQLFMSSGNDSEGGVANMLNTVIDIIENRVVKNKEKVMLFVPTTAMADFLTDIVYALLAELKIRPPMAPLKKQQQRQRNDRRRSYMIDAIMSLSGRMSQTKRTNTFLDFRDIESGLMICTSVAARGLDISGISLVVQWGIVDNVEDYVHRIGRTARVDKSGQALVMLLPEEQKFLNVLQNTENGVGLDIKEYSESSTPPRVTEELLHDVVTKRQLVESATQVYGSFLGFYTSIKDGKYAPTRLQALGLAYRFARSFGLDKLNNGALLKLPDRLVNMFNLDRELRELGLAGGRRYGDDQTIDPEERWNRLLEMQRTSNDKTAPFFVKSKSMGRGSRSRASFGGSGDSYGRSRSASPRSSSRRQDFGERGGYRSERSDSRRERGGYQSDFGERGGYRSERSDFGRERERGYRSESGDRRRSFSAERSDRSDRRRDSYSRTKSRDFDSLGFDL